MIRMTKLTDYASVLMTFFAREADRGHNARDLAHDTHLPLPTVSKVLKALARGGLLESQRGMNGGYALSRPPEDISLADILAAMEGPVALTQCNEPKGKQPCPQESLCPVTDNWKRINVIVRQALSNITLAEMATPLPRFFGAPRLPQASSVRGA